MNDRSNSDSPGNLDNRVADNSALILPAFGKLPQLVMEMGNIREAEMRLVEAKTVNPVTYVDLEHTFNEAYRDLKRHLSAVSFQLDMADKVLEQAKANVILDRYPEYMKDRPKSHDSADMRKAFMMRDDEYLAALDRVNQLKAVQSMLDGKLKVMERVSAYMKKNMDIIIRSGINPNLYNTQGRK